MKKKRKWEGFAVREVFKGAELLPNFYLFYNRNSAIDFKEKSKKQNKAYYTYETTKIRVEEIK